MRFWRWMLRGLVLILALLGFVGLLDIAFGLGDRRFAVVVLVFGLLLGVGFLSGVDYLRRSNENRREVRGFEVVQSDDAQEK